MSHVAGYILFQKYRGFSRALQWHCLLPLNLGLIICFFSTSLTAQDLGDLLKNANEYFDKEQYHTAAQYYQMAVGLRDYDPEINYRLAQSYRIIFNYSLAAHYYQRTVELDEITYPLSPFYLAQMRKSIGDFKKAKDGFENFIATNSVSSFIPKSEKDNFIRQAEVEMEGCLWAIDQLGKSWREMGFTILPEPVNSSSNDYAAVTAGDDRLVTITSGKRGARGGLMDNRFGEYFTDNFRYKNQENTWSPVGTSDHFDRTNTKFSDGVGAYNAAGVKYYFTSCYEGSAFCKLYVTYKQNGIWKDPQLLNENVNAPGYDNKHPALTQGGDTLIFVSNRPGGPGGNDIWFSVSRNGEAWEVPHLLPGDINTPFNEASPFIQTGNLLFFSSDGHIGMGGMDIFMSNGYQSTTSKIQNLGTPFNSGYDDSFFSLGTGKGYLSSNRPGGHGKFDIYSFNLPTEKTDLADYLEESAEGTQLRSRIRSNDGSNLYSARDEDQFYYDNLTADEKARLDRILALRQQSEQEFDPKQLSKDDFRYYNKLDITAKATIERLAHKRILQLEGLTSKNAMTIQDKLDWEYYQNIDEEHREIVDRIIDVRVEGRRNAIDRLSPEEQDHALIYSNQERIEIKVQLKALDSLTESLRRQQLTGFSLTGTQRLMPGTQHTATTEIARIKPKGHLKLLEGMDFAHQLHYQGLSLDDRSNLHQSAVRQYILDNQHIAPEERKKILNELDLESDPMNSVATDVTTSEYQKSLEIRQVLKENLLKDRVVDSQLSIIDQLVLEMDGQQLMLQQQFDIISQKESEAHNLQQELQQFLEYQEKAPDSALEQRIVDQYYEQSLRLLPLLTPKVSYYFNELSPGQQLRLDRLAWLVYTQTRKLETVAERENNYIARFTPTDHWFYQELPKDHQEILDGLVALGGTHEVTYNIEQQDFLDNLSALDRARVDRMMGYQKKPNFEVPKESRIALDSNREDPTGPTLNAGDNAAPLQTVENSIGAEIFDNIKEETQSADIRHFEASVIATVGINPVEQVNYLSAQIYFDFDRHKLRPEAQETLKELINFLRQQENPVKVMIDGHTDNIGSIAHNDQLGRRRSLSTAEFIQSSPSPFVITTKSYGEERPVSHNETAMGKQFNRRVELKILGIPYQSPLGAYLVKPNVTLSMIIETTGLLEDDILKWNGLQDKELAPYQPLRLPVDLDYRPIKHLLYYPKKYATESNNPAIHTVRRGENLFRLAQRYHTTVQVLEGLNNINATDLLAGQQLRVR